MGVWSSFIRSFNPAEPGYEYMWALLALAVAAVVLAVERGFYLLRKASFRPEAFMREIFKNISQGNIAGALKQCEGSSSAVLPRIIHAGLKEADSGSERMQNALDEETLTQVPQLESRLGYLTTVASVATLLGLMGTIYGLIVSFSAVGKPGINAAKKSELLAQGISAAMNTTLAGLAIAIPCMLIFAFYSSKVQAMIDEIEEYSIKMLNMLTHRSFKTHKYHIKAEHISEGVGLHITNKNIKIFADNKLIKEINL